MHNKLSIAFLRERRFSIEEDMSKNVLPSGTMGHLHLSIHRSKQESEPAQRAPGPPRDAWGA